MIVYVLMHESYELRSTTWIIEKSSDESSIVLSVLALMKYFGT